MVNRATFQVLLVDDDAAIRRQLRGVLEDEGHTVAEAPNAAAAYAALESGSFDAVLLDIRMPGESGLDALVRLTEQAPDTAVIIVSGEGTLENALKAGQRGAFDFVEKPIRDPDGLLGTLAEAVRVTRMRRGTRAAGAVAGPAVADGDLGILGTSSPIEKLLEQVRRVAPSAGRVLITGENGAGKELVAHAIHRLSKRATGPFVKLNCAAIPKDLLESELFGYERGAFTGAVQSKKGRLEMADGGTLFLDEVGDLALDAQAKLLRAIETGELERVGGTRTERVDVRLVAATNRDLAEAMRTGEFRQDLFYRINTITVSLPPLREKREDIPLLVKHFLEQNAAYGHKVISPAALLCLEQYHWPGNVRELQHAIQRAVILSTGEEIQPDDLPNEVRGGGAGAAGASGGAAAAVPPGGSLEEMERVHIIATLKRVGGHRAKAAALLGIDPKTLYRKILGYNITPEQARG